MGPANCSKCGALIDPLALECPYCRFTTPAGVAAKQREEYARASQAQWQAQAQHQRRAVDDRNLGSSATHALLWSIAGVVLCCLPLGVVGIVMGVRARGLAGRLNQPVPVKATIGIVLGALSSIASVGFFTYAMIRSQKSSEASEQRIAVIQKQIGDKASAEVLDQATACGLAEIHARQVGWDGHPDYSLDDFDCVGKLTVAPDGERAELEDLRFMWSSTTYDVNVCFKRGAKWYVDDMREGSCEEAPAPPATSLDATTD